MTRATRFPEFLTAALLIIAAMTANSYAADAAGDDGPGKTADSILAATAVQGGLIVHVGCGDGQLTAALCANDRYLVHGLDTDAAAVQRARKLIHARGLSGRVTADTFRGYDLPLVNNLVNLIVVEVQGRNSTYDLMRVLAPGGVAYVNDGDRWKLTRKPWPKEIDQWTHYLHDASNNAVAHDEQVGPPRHLQWQAGPRWSRHHDHMASISAMVTANGRLFSVVDEGSRVSPQLPSDWKLIGRDAFNGVLLWKRAIPRWHDRLWPLKSGPANLPRRLVAEGDTVYATLGIEAPVTALDAATGETLREYAETAGAEEIISCGGVLLVLVNRTPVDPKTDLADDVEEGRSRDHRTTYSPKMGEIWAGIRSRRWTHGDRAILAFDAKSGRPLWKLPSRVIPLTLAADRRQAYFHNGEKIIAVDLQSGREAWTSEPVPVWEGLEGQGLQSWFAPTLVVCDGKVIFAGGEKIHMSYVGWGSSDIGDDTMTAFSAETGKRVWTAPHPYSGYNSPEDLFVTGGKVWTGVTAKGGAGGRYIGRSLATGELDEEFPPTVNTFWFHHRCYRAKATDQYILCSRTGIELVDLATGQWDINHWVRGGCLYGIMPANGLIYSPPHPCACYPEAKLYGFTALAASPARDPFKENPPEARLQKGPAYGQTPDTDQQSPSMNPAHWPTYRHDPTRSGATGASIDAELQEAWEVELGGRLTQPVVAEGRMYVADVDRHTIHALDANTGKRLWSHIAGGRVDSPPTCDCGRLLFGAADGYVTCLRAADGAVVWRFLVAGIDQRTVAFDQLESVWPVHGSVLVQDGVATVVAGRSMYLDGGLWFCRLDAETGRLLSGRVLDDRDPESGENMQTHVRGLNMPVALPDVLAGDGEHLYMRSQVMDREGNRQGLGTGDRDHLFAAYGFTDDTYFHRTYWLFGRSFKGGVGGFGNAKSKPAGFILANDEKAVFGFGRKPEFYRWSSVADYQLFAAVRPGGNAGLARAVYFENTDSLDPTAKPLSIAAWVKPETADGTILVRGAQQVGFALILTDRKPRMLLRAGGKTFEVIAERPIGDDWAHVAGVLEESGRMTVYVDGQPAGSVDGVPLPTGNPAIPMKIGYDDTNQLLPQPLVPFNGALDEVMLLHRALSPAEIAGLAGREMKLDRQFQEGLVLHLPMTGGKTRDRSPGKNHGRIAGAVKTVTGPMGDALRLVQPKNIVAAAGASGSGVAYLWTRDVPMMVRALAKADDKLLIAGPPRVLDEVTAFASFAEPATQEQIAAADAALKGRSGALLQVVDAATGDMLAERKLESPPVFDGLSVAAGRVFIATMDGRVMALGEK